MNLLFYSGGYSDVNNALDTRLIELVGKRAKITYIPTSSDNGESYFELFREDKKKIGLKQWAYMAPDRPITREQLSDALSSDAIFLSGGNTFYFLYHLRRSGLLTKLRRYAQEGGVLFGMSAGALMMTPRIDLAGYIAGESDENTVAIEEFDSLSLVDFEVYPHFVRSEASVSGLLAYSKKRGPVYAFPDGSGVVVTGSGIEFHGAVTCFHGGKSFELSPL